jgi:hypothetical protein
MTAGAVLLGFAIRTTVGADAPLWLDETFTGAIAAQPSLWSVVHQILQDVNAPIYCLLAHAWSQLFTLSNQSLRFPALVFGSIAPLLCLIPTPGIARRTRLLWCSLIATHEDPNTRLVALADQPHSAILWIYDTNVHDTAARTYPPRITELASAWQCRDFGSPPIGILACTQKDAA